MSLLMQALKKAERAKQISGEAELEKPSEAFDELLALSPQPQPPAPAAPAAPPPPPSLGDLSLEPLSLTPIAATPAPAATAAPAAEPDAAPFAALEMSADSLPPIPVLRVAEEALHDPVPPQARHQTEAAAPTPSPAPEPSASARVKAELKADMAAAASAAPVEATAKASKGGKSGKEGGAAARARAAASSTPGSDVGGMDPAKLRIAGLAGVVLLILLGYGYYFWQAVYGPGSGARLPMVPMPPPNATGATSGVVVLPGAGNKAPGGPAPAAGEEEGQLSDSQRAREASLMAQIAALQASMQQQNHPNGPDTLPPVAAPEPSEVKVVRTAHEPRLDPSLSGGYAALSSGDLANARNQYDTALRQDPNNRDALLGAAAVALRQQQTDKAGALYSRLLELDPNDADALAGLAGLRQGDPVQTEQRLTAALRSNPDSGPVLFALGNLYARQGRWSEAQQSYFRAYSAVPGNADYAVNLAIGLDRLNQGRLALGYYQKALALAQDKPASFDRDAVHRRMQELNQARRALSATAPAASPEIYGRTSKTPPRQAADPERRDQRRPVAHCPDRAKAQQ